MLNNFYFVLHSLCNYMFQKKPISSINYCLFSIYEKLAMPSLQRISLHIPCFNEPLEFSESIKPVGH